MGSDSCHRAAKVVERIGDPSLANCRTTAVSSPPLHSKAEVGGEMAPRRRNGYKALRPHAARVIKVAQFPMHVNGAYLDDPDRIPVLDRGASKA